MRYCDQLIADVDGAFERRQARIARRQLRHDDLGEERVRRWDEVQPADPAEVRLEEAQRLGPVRRGEVADGVEPAEHRILDAVRLT
jgi:hypothetical protein